MIRYTSIRLFTALTLSSVLMSCGFLNQQEDDNMLTMLALAATPATLPVSLVSNDATISCNQTFTLGANSSVQIRDFRLYLSEFAWVTPEGEVSATVPDVTGWQKDGVVLIDLEDGTGHCSTSGTSDTNAQIIISQPPANATGLSFSVGLPTTQNKLDNATSDAPFNIASMYWSWTSGYKFTKLEFTDGSDVINFHLGSTACTATVNCTNEMKGRVTISGVSVANGIQFDLSDWFSGQTYAATTCMGNTVGDATLCGVMRNRMGLNQSNGTANQSNAQGFEAR